MSKGFTVLKYDPFTEAVCSIVRRELHPRAAVSFFNEVDLTAVDRLRRSQPEGERIPYNAYLTRAVARAMREFPYANRMIAPRWLSFMRRARTVQFESVDIGFAVERELPDSPPIAFVDIIRDADTLSLEEITGWLKQLRTADLDNNSQWRSFYRIITTLPRHLASFLIGLPVRSTDLWRKYRGGPVLISCPAKYGVDMVATTWSWPLGVSIGMVRERPIVRAGEIVVAPTAMLTLVFDRRVMAGAQAARFFKRLTELMEDPT